jgi:ketosteroid isomerase-like protein
MSRDLEERNLKTVQALFAATGSGDWAKAATLLTDDLFITEADNNPFKGVYRGRNALQELFGKVMSAVSVTKMDIKQVTAGGDLVIAAVELHLSSGGVASLCEMFRLREGKVCEIKPYYFDPKPLADAIASKRS